MIRKSFLRLSLLHHPDKNKNSPEAKARFQNILDAYEIAGKAVQDTIYDDDDVDDVLARKMFKQFSFSSVKENLCSFTIITEKPLHSIWSDVLLDNFGTPHDLKSHGLKFTVPDNCQGRDDKLFVTLYKTGKMLIQAKGNDHAVSVHYVNEHLGSLYKQVYNKKKNHKHLTHKTPLTKPTGRKTVSRILTCLKCDFKCSDVGIFYHHKKKEHSNSRSGKSKFKVINTLDAKLCLDTFADTTDDDVNDTPVKEIPPSQDKHEVVCTVCKCTFLTEFDLNLHVVTNHSPHSLLDPEQAPLLKLFEAEFSPNIDRLLTLTPAISTHCCMLCGESFTDEYRLEKHIESDHEITCNICNAQFYDSFDLNIHIQTQHMTSKFHSCDAVEHSISHQVNKTLITIAEMISPCTFCTFVASSSSELGQHVMYHHTSGVTAVTPALTTVTQNVICDDTPDKSFHNARLLPSI